MQQLSILRKSKGLTQKEIAEHIGVSRQAYANYESGNREPDFKTLLKLAEYLDVSTDYLLGETDEIKEKAPAEVSEEDLKVALFGGDREVSEEMWNEVLDYAKYLKQKYDKT